MKSGSKIILALMLLSIVALSACATLPRNPLPNDGTCDRAGGEDEQSSPQDCKAPSGQNLGKNGYIPPDLGQDSAGKSWVKIVDGQGLPIATGGAGITYMLVFCPVIGGEGFAECRTSGPFSANSNPVFFTSANDGVYSLAFSGKGYADSQVSAYIEGAMPYGMSVKMVKKPKTGSIKLTLADGTGRSIDAGKTKIMMDIAFCPDEKIPEAMFAEGWAQNGECWDITGDEMESNPATGELPTGRWDITFYGDGYERKNVKFDLGENAIVEREVRLAGRQELLSAKGALEGAIYFDEPAHVGKTKPKTDDWKIVIIEVEDGATRKAVNGAKVTIFTSTNTIMEILTTYGKSYQINDPAVSLRLDPGTYKFAASYSDGKGTSVGYIVAKIPPMDKWFPPFSIIPHERLEFLTIVLGKQPKARVAHRFRIVDEGGRLFDVGAQELAYKYGFGDPKKSEGIGHGQVGDNPFFYTQDNNPDFFIFTSSGYEDAQVTITENPYKDPLFRFQIKGKVYNHMVVMKKKKSSPSPNP